MNQLKTKLGAFALAGVLFTTSSITVCAFDDYNTSSTWKWAGDHIHWAAREEIAAGKGNNLFDADGLITRAEAVAAIVSAMEYELEKDAEAAFGDIAGEWYTDYINTAYAHDIVGGKSEDVFDPNANVTRAEMVTMIHSTMKENFEVGMMSAIFTCEIPGSFVVVNADGQSVDYDENRTEAEGGSCIADMEDYRITPYTPSGLSIDLPTTASLDFQCSLRQTEGIVFYGTNAVVDISGTNIDRIKVSKNGTICLYGTDMTYTVEIENMADTLTFSETTADDVVLKVVEQQLMEITE